ncbi:hypothetical protein D9757_011857 [Collybiopsis confluens]|uniref:Uncharacterized protein n=1 Tax=Collybiopsis confluens TaxID=2823264 RepID=A0A8H5D3Q1_9AGAR|nr:hypothetical protein D9757_011857 [Collybiopsis confluens]
MPENWSLATWRLLQRHPIRGYPDYRSLNDWFHPYPKVMFLLLAETVSVWTDFAAVWEPLIAVSGSIRELEFSPIGLRADLKFALPLTFLSKMRNKGNSATTDSVIDRIIRTTVQTGALTSVGAIADLLTFAFFRSTFLNARTKWQNILDREVTAPVIPMDASESGLAPPSRNGYPKHLSPNSFALMSPVLFAAATQLTPPEQSHTVEGRYDYDTVPKSNAGNAFDV